MEKEDVDPLIPKIPTSSWLSHFTIHSLLRKYHPSLEDIQGTDLKRSLSLWELIGFGIATTVGAGIFVTVGIVAREKSGPSIVISFLLAGMIIDVINLIHYILIFLYKYIAGFASFLSAMCYSEFASRIPLSGSAYTFAYISLGELTAWL